MIYLYFKIYIYRVVKQMIFNILTSDVHNCVYIQLGGTYLLPIYDFIVPIRYFNKTPPRQILSYKRKIISTYDTVPAG